MVQWGDVGTWVGGIGTSGALLVAFVQLGRLLKDHEAEQAALVSAWISASKMTTTAGTSTPDAAVEITFRNVSTQPIGRILFEVRVGSDRRQEGFGPLPPDSTITKEIHFGALASGVTLLPELDIWFTDEAGRSWLRPHAGALHKRGTMPNGWQDSRLAVSGNTAGPDNQSHQSSPTTNGGNGVLENPSAHSDLWR